VRLYKHASLVLFSSGWRFITHILTANCIAKSVIRSFMKADGKVVIISITKVECISRHNAAGVTARRLTRSSYSCRCKSIVSTCWENRQVVRWLSYVESLSLMFSFFLCTRLQHRLHPWLRMLTVRRRNQTKNRSITITRLSLLLEFRVSLVCSCKYCNGFLCCGSDVMKLASSLST